MPTNFLKPLLEGMKIAALCGAIALVLWSMPDDRQHYAAAAADDGVTVSRDADHGHGPIHVSTKRRSISSYCGWLATKPPLWSPRSSTKALGGWAASYTFLPSR